MRLVAWSDRGRMPGAARPRTGFWWRAGWRPSPEPIRAHLDIAARDALLALGAVALAMMLTARKRRRAGAKDALIRWGRFLGRCTDLAPERMFS
jgi:hypothetical protein